MKNRIDSSRSKTPWDNSENLTQTQTFIMDKYKSTFQNKHPKINQTSEKDLLNSLVITNCRFCDSSYIIKRGKNQNGVQIYYCKNCNRRFNPTTGTIFENHKISITEWIEYMLCLFNYGSTTLISKMNKNSVNTSTFWMHKLFLILKDYQNSTILKGNAYIDEMFYKVIKKDIVKVNNKELRGQSRNQYCIGVGYDGDNIYAIVEGLGKTSTNKTNKTFYKHIEMNSILIHDDEKSHNDLIEKLSLIDESYNSKFLKRKNDKENPLRPINHQIDLIRQFLNAHSGFDRTDLQNYLNLYCFMNSGHMNKLEKINQLLEMALNTKISLNYRDFFANDDSK